MKNFYFFLILTLIFNINKAADFAPTGAQWYYTEGFAFSGDIRYLYIESAGDTIIKSKNCKKLINNGSLACAFYSNPYVTYEEDSIVYFYIPENDTFQVLYNMKAQKGDSWNIVFNTYFDEIQDTLMVTVDSVSYILINDYSLKQLYVKYSSLNNGWEDQWYPGKIVERIGDISYLFNLYGLSGAICDANYSGGLRCYSDSVIGSYSTGIAPSCTYTYDWVSTEVNESSDFEIGPNPVNDIINLTHIEKIRSVSLINSNGVYIKNYTPQLQINISDIPKGFYLIEIQSFNNVKYFKMILKN